MSKKIATYSILIALALIASFLERLVPISFTVPGIKLGLANIVIVAALYLLNSRAAVAIALVKVLVAGLLFGGASQIIFGLSGTALSLIIMIPAKKTNLFSIIGVSILGAISHNLGQLTAASIIVEDIRLFFYYTPALMLSGLLAGLTIGTLAFWVVKKIPSRLYS